MEQKLLSACCAELGMRATVTCSRREFACSYHACTCMQPGIKGSAGGRTHVLDLDATDGIHEGNSELVAGDSSQAGSDGVSGSRLEHLVIHLLRALACAFVLGAEGGDLRMQSPSPQLGLHSWP